MVIAIKIAVAVIKENVAEAARVVRAAISLVGLIKEGGRLAPS